MFQVSSSSHLSQQQNMDTTIPNANTPPTTQLTQSLACSQRIKNFNIDTFLDSKIAEEQARQTGQPGAAGAAPKRSSSNAGPRRGSGRTDSPAKRAGSRLRVPENDGAIAKAPDPEDFVIGDDGSRSLKMAKQATPRKKEERKPQPTPKAKQNKAMETPPSSQTQSSRSSYGSKT
jgi:hypothetical protein